MSATFFLAEIYQADFSTIRHLMYAKEVDSFFFNQVCKYYFLIIALHIVVNIYKLSIN